MNATTTTDTAAQNVELLIGLLGRLNEFTTNMRGEITDGDGGEWTPADLTKAIAGVREKLEELNTLATFAEKAAEME